MKKLATSTILMAIGFLLIVILYGKVKNFFFEENIPSEVGYSIKQVIVGGLGESIRAFLTSWLYRYHKTDKSLIANALLFGIVCSALVASVWLIVGVEFINPSNKLSFIIDDGIILLLQGIISGVVLWIVYKRKERPTYDNA